MLSKRRDWYQRKNGLNRLFFLELPRFFVTGSGVVGSLDSMSNPYF
ncbi:hypothetical protein XBI1_2680011 [Xenorhabdus bovienii str. Intermedium]|uniref:Uncharacterized protein n=1 Tax=Xenorhabdus bovienii str. Intermedium TaxID=1379677 RepID=A0A077QJZ5_XENBV|nr:hypothetical protein XBI1_2680011 [Xenorhabdus bovienii str. Intermedium]